MHVHVHACTCPVWLPWNGTHAQARAGNGRVTVAQRTWAVKTGTTLFCSFRGCTPRTFTSRPPRPRVGPASALRTSDSLFGSHCTCMTMVNSVPRHIILL